MALAAARLRRVGRRRPRRAQPIPRNAARRALSPQPPRAVELLFVQALHRTAARFAKAVGRILYPRLAAFAKPEDETVRTDEREDDADALVSQLRDAATRAFDTGEFEAASTTAAKRTVLHSQKEFGRLGIKLIEAEPKVAKLVDGWRKDNVGRVRGMQADQLDKIERILKDGGSHRVETLEKELRRQVEDVTKSRAELIARDQVLTLNAQITRERHQAAGITSFAWTTSGDERVRDSHDEIDGDVFSYDDPPNVDGETALPGEPVLCRCVAFPILPELGEEEPDDGGGDGDGDGGGAEPPGGGGGGDDGGDDDDGDEPPPRPLPRIPVKTAEAVNALEVEQQGGGVLGDVESASKLVFGAGKVPTLDEFANFYRPPAGYQLRLKEVSTALGGLTVSFDLLTDDGRFVTVVTRSFWRDRGKLVAKHDLIRIRDDVHKNKGIARSMTRNALLRYAAMGVDRVELDAAWDGRYRWARWGWRWRNASDLLQMRRDLVGYLTKEHGVSARAAKKLAASLEQPSDFADLKLSGNPVGMHFLAGTDANGKDYTGMWDGVLRLEPGDPGYELARERLDLDAR